MPTNLYSPEQLDPVDIDEFLAEGWRFWGQDLYEADYVMLTPEILYAVLPTRLPLADHQWGKRQRKLLRRNRQRFRVECGPAYLSGDKYRVHQAYADLYPDKAAANPQTHLRWGANRDILTWECRVYDGPELVAFSFFERGKEAAYSKMGVYHPDYRAHSLGLFTLLEEAEFCKQQGHTYYYPGYVSPDLPVFDYKHQLGALEYWNLASQQWFPFTQFDPDLHHPLRLIYAQLGQLRQALLEAGAPVEGYEYHHILTRLVEDMIDLLDEPVILLVAEGADARRPRLLVVYELQVGEFQLWEVCLAGESMPMLTPYERHDRWPICPYLFRYQQLLFNTPHTRDMVEEVLRLRLTDAWR